MAISIRWQADAEQRLEKVPFFIRPLVRRRAESAARERGLAGGQRSAASAFS